jgi:hypothetical protein
MSSSQEEKRCNLESNSASDYKDCMYKANLPVFKSNRIRITPNQAMNRAVSLILVLLFLHYIKVITLPLKFIPQMK